MHICTRLGIFGGLMLSLLAVNVWAQKTFTPITDQEIGMLPWYCAAKMRSKDPRDKQRLIQAFEQTWIHMHHYCSGINALNRARTIFSAKVRKGFYEFALGQFKYVANNARDHQTFVLWPELHLNLGKSREGAGQIAAAMTDYRKAITLKRDYVPGYVALSDALRAAGDLESARTLLNEGLQQSPDSKWLKRKLEKLSN